MFPISLLVRDRVLSNKLWDLDPHALQLPSRYSLLKLSVLTKLGGWSNTSTRMVIFPKYFGECISVGFLKGTAYLLGVTSPLS